MIWEFIFYFLATVAGIGGAIAIYSWWKMRWVKKAEESLPEMLENMASMLDKGLSIEYALAELYKTGPEGLKPYLRNVLKERKKGLEMHQALLVSLGNLKKSTAFTFAVNMISKGLEQGSPLVSLLRTIGSSQRKINQLEKERRGKIIGMAGINLILTPIMLGALSTVLTAMGGEGPLLAMFIDMFKLYSIIAGSVAMVLVYFLSRKSNTILMLLPFGAFLGFAPVYVILEVIS